jgi:hypothetical protein
MVGGHVGRAVAGRAGVGVGVGAVDVRRGRLHGFLVQRRQTTWTTILRGLWSFTTLMPDSLVG